MAKADLLEFQWTEYFCLATRTSATRSGAPSIGFAHDVLTQKYKRRLLGRPSRSMIRLAESLRLLITIRDERRAVKGLDAVATFSEKDKHLLEDLSPQTSCVTLRPPLHIHPRENNVSQLLSILMVANFTRSENEQAAMWFLEQVWPSIQDSMPGVLLTLAGSGPSDRMRTAATRHKSVTVTGYLENLESTYASATLAVIPLHLGAGVKFKTIEAMLSGVPIVSTTVGVEGIASRESDVWCGVEDEAPEFASAVVRALRNPRAAQATAKRAQIFATRRYGEAQYSHAIDNFYTSVVTHGLQ